MTLARAALASVAALALSGCVGVSLDGAGFFMCPPATHCILEMLPVPGLAPPPGLPGLPLPLP